MYFMQIKPAFSDFVIYDKQHLTKALVDMYRKEMQEKTGKTQQV